MKKFKTLKMARNLIAWNMLIIIIPIIFLTNSLLNKYQKDFDNQTKEDAKSAFFEVVFSLDENISMMKGLLFSLSNNGDLIDKIGKKEDYTEEDILLMDQVYAKDLESLIYSYPKINGLRIFNDNTAMYEFWPVIYSLNRIIDPKLVKDITTETKLWRILDKEAYFQIYKERGEKGKTISFFSNVKRPLSDHNVIVEVSMDLDTFFRGLEKTSKEDKEFYYILQDGAIIKHSENTDALLEGQAEAFEAWLKLQLSSNHEGVFEVTNHKNKIIGNAYTLEETGTTIFQGVTTKQYGETIKQERTRIILIMCVLSAFLLFIILSITGVMFKRLQHLIEAVQKIDKSQPTEFAVVEGKDEITDLSRHIKTMIDEIHGLNQLNLYEQQLAMDAEIKALLSQINEHFIYNMLETFKMMAEIEENYELSDLITKFGELLRYSMDWKNKKVVTLQEELDSIQKYIYLINQRYDYEVRLKLEIEAGLETTEIIKMSIQPIIENAFLHGIEPKSEDSQIIINVHYEDTTNKTVLLEITDDGVGMSEQMVRDINNRLQGLKLNQSSELIMGIGIENINDRIKMYFGDAYGILVTSIEGIYTKVTIRVPRGGDIHARFNR